MSSSSIQVSRSKLALIVLILAASPAALGNVIESEERDYHIIEPRLFSSLTSALTGRPPAPRGPGVVTRLATNLQRKATTVAGVASGLTTIASAVSAGRRPPAFAPQGFAQPAFAQQGLPPPLPGQFDPSLGAVDANGFPLDPSLDPSLGGQFAAAPAPLLARSYDEYALHTREPEPEPFFHELFDEAAAKVPVVLNKAKTALQSFATKSTNTAAVALVGGASVAAAGPLGAGSIDPLTGLPFDASGATIDPATGLPLGPGLAPLVRREPSPEPLFGTEKLASKAAAFVLAKAPGLASKAKGFLKGIFKKKTTTTSTTAVAGGAGVAVGGVAGAGVLAAGAGVAAAVAAAPLAAAPLPPLDPLAAPLPPLAAPIDPLAATLPPLDPTGTIDPATGLPANQLPIDPATGQTLATTAAAPLAVRSVERRCVARRGTAGARAYARCIESLNELD